jgi:hypothetical protein
MSRSTDDTRKVNTIKSHKSPSVIAADFTDNLHQHLSSEHERHDMTGCLPTANQDRAYKPCFLTATPLAVY